MGAMDSFSGSVDKAFRLLEAVTRDNGQQPLSRIAADLGLPRATAHRMAQALERAGWLIRSRRGYYHAGSALAAIAPHSAPAAVAAGIARPLLVQLAARQHCLAHLGVFEQDMVTYRLKEGARADMLFTRKDMQLEAYCSGLGKVLLAALDDDALDAYLANGPFVALTPNTIVEPGALRAEIAQVRDRGYALDNCEVSEALSCIAAPLASPAGQVFAAISLSFPSAVIRRSGWDRPLADLLRAAERISLRMRGFWGGGDL